MNIYLSNSFNPFENFCLENFFLEKKEADQTIFFLWINQPSLFMGRFQNPWLEVNMELVNKDKIPILRRRSGGGCVYHDQGNLNISVLSKNFKCTSMIMEILKNLGLSQCYMGEKGDLLIETKKFSGSAYYHHKNSFLHHCTLLFESELEILQKYLNSPLDTLILTKAIKSRKANVANLREYGVDMQLFIRALQEKLRVGLYKISNPIKFVGENYWVEFNQQFISYPWIFERTPKFTLKNPSDQAQLIHPWQFF